jgi:hypothetical protein
LLTAALAAAVAVTSCSRRPAAPRPRAFARSCSSTTPPTPSKHRQRPEVADREPPIAAFPAVNRRHAYLHSPILNHQNGTRIGTAYSQFTVVRGNNFANAVFRGHGAFRLHEGQIAADGVFAVAKATKTVAVLGGTGAYEAAHRSLTFTEGEGGSQDSFHLLPSAAMQRSEARVSGFRR